MMTRVFDVIRRETLSADSVNVSGSISAKTGFPPMRLTASAVKAAVRGVVTTSSPGPTPTAIKARAIASVPFPTPTALPQSKEDTISRSNASTSGPRMNHPEARTLAMAASISGAGAAPPRERSLKRTSGDIVTDVLTVELDGSPGALAEIHARPPTEPSLDLPVVGIEIADIDAAALFGEGNQSIARLLPRDLVEDLDELPERRGRRRPEVENFTLQLVVRPRGQERFHHVIDVVEVAFLLPVAVEEDLLSQHHLSDEPSGESLAVVLQKLARSVGVGEAEGRRPKPVYLPVDSVVHLPARFVDSVDVGGVNRMVLVRRKAHGLSINLARAGVHDADPRVPLAAGLQDRELALAVDLEVGHGVGHAVDMADLAREVEEDVLAGDEVLHSVRVPHVGDIDL